VPMMPATTGPLFQADADVRLMELRWLKCLSTSIMSNAISAQRRRARARVGTPPTTM